MDMFYSDWAFLAWAVPLVVILVIVWITHPEARS